MECCMQCATGLQTSPIHATKETSPNFHKVAYPKDVGVAPWEVTSSPKSAHVDVHGLNREIGHSPLRCRSTINKRVACDIDVLCCIMHSSQDRSLAPLDHRFDCTLVCWSVRPLLPWPILGGYRCPCTLKFALLSVRARHWFWLSGSVQKELKEIDRDKASGVTIQITEGNLQKLTGFVEGPKDTAYEGGYFVVDITLGRLTFARKFWY